MINENKIDLLSSGEISKIQVPTTKREVFNVIAGLLGSNYPGLHTKEEINQIILSDIKEHFKLSNNDVVVVKSSFKEIWKTKEAALKDTRATILKEKMANKVAANIYSIGISEEFKGLYEESINDKTGDILIIPYQDLIAYRVINDLNVIMYEGNTFCFRGGYYRNDELSVQAEVTRILVGICKRTDAKGIAGMLNNTMAIIHNTNIKYVYPFNNYPNIIPVRNGLIVIDYEKETFELLPDHKPKEYMFNYKMDVVYDPEANNTVLLDILKTCSPDDYNKLIQAVAQGIMQMLGFGPYKKAYLLKGKRNTGKTSYLDMIEWIAGKMCIGRVSLAEMTPDHKFKRVAMEGKMFNIYDDLGYFKMDECGEFKTLTGGYSHSVEKKGLDSYNALITAVHIFTTNSPAGYDKRMFQDDAFWGRWEYIEFNHEFGIVGDFKKNTMTDENMSALFNEILKMVLKIHKNRELPHTMKWKDARSKWTQENNILYKFIEDNMVKGGETPLLKEEFYRTVVKWCNDERSDDILVPRNTYALGDLVEMLGGERDARRRIDGVQKHCYILHYMWRVDSEYKLDKLNCVKEELDF